MTQGQAPYGTFGTIGHPANKSYIVKTSFERGRRVNTGDLVDDEDFRAGWDILYLPGESDV